MSFQDLYSYPSSLLYLWLWKMMKFSLFLIRASGLEANQRGLKAPPSPHCTPQPVFLEGLGRRGARVPVQPSTAWEDSSPLPPTTEAVWNWLVWKRVQPLLRLDDPGARAATPTPGHRCRRTDPSDPAQPGRTQSPLVSGWSLNLPGWAGIRMGLARIYPRSGCLTANGIDVIFQGLVTLSPAYVPLQMTTLNHVQCSTQCLTTSFLWFERRFYND